MGNYGGPICQHFKDTDITVIADKANIPLALNENIFSEVRKRLTTSNCKKCRCIAFEIIIMIL